MVSAFIIFILLLSVGLLASFLFGRTFETALPMSIFVIIAVLYVFGIFGILEAGVYLIAALGTAAFIFDCIYIIRKKIKILSILTPGLVIFTFLILFSWWAQRGRLFSQWDEFSNWGLVVKNMFALNALPNSPGATTFFTGYPPGSALFEYLGVRLPGVYSESSIYRAMNIFYFSLTIPLFTDLKWKNIIRIILRIAFIIVLPLVFYDDFYTTVYVDGILGILFAYALISYFTSDIGKFTFLNTGLSLFVLTLIKDSGFGLSLIALIIVILDLLLFRRKELITYVSRKTRGSLNRIFTVSCPLILIFTAKYSWVIYLNATGTPASAGMLFGGSYPEYGLKVVNSFIYALANNPLTGGTLKVSFVQWIAVFILAGAVFIALFCRKGEKGRYVFYLSGVLLFLLVYAGILLLAYLYNFSEYEALNLASFNRYVSTYVLGALAIFSALILIKEKDVRYKWKKCISGLMILLILYTANLTSVDKVTDLEYESAKNTQITRSLYSDEQVIENFLDPEQDKLYFISAGDKGFDYWVTRYTFTPVKINDNFSWSLGKPYFDGDIWTKDESPEDWSKVLEDGYTYVYIFKTNAAFSAEYGILFEGGTNSVTNDTLYSVEKGTNTVILRKINISSK